MDDSSYLRPGASLFRLLNTQMLGTVVSTESAIQSPPSLTPSAPHAASLCC